MWVGLLQSGEGHKRTKTDLSGAGKNSASRLILNLNCNSSWVSGLLAYLIWFWTCQASIIIWDNSLKQTSLYTQTHDLLVFFAFWRILTTIGNLHKGNENQCLQRYCTKALIAALLKIFPNWKQSITPLNWK